MTSDQADTLIFLVQTLTYATCFIAAFCTVVVMKHAVTRRNVLMLLVALSGAAVAYADPPAGYQSSTFTIGIHDVDLGDYTIGMAWGNGDGAVYDGPPDFTGTDSIAGFFMEDDDGGDFVTPYGGTWWYGDPFDGAVDSGIADTLNPFSDGALVDWLAGGRETSVSGDVPAAWESSEGSTFHSDTAGDIPEHFTPLSGGGGGVVLPLLFADTPGLVTAMLVALSVVVGGIVVAWAAFDVVKIVFSKWLNCVAGDRPDISKDRAVINLGAAQKAEEFSKEFDTSTW